MEARKINLALQGGGAHGAYTWGVLDRLLEEEQLVIDAVSGTSAGAMNAAVLVDGFAADGRAGARQALENFWRRISEAGARSPLRWHSPLEGWLGNSPYNLDNNPFYRWFDLLGRILSPYELNPLNHNPLRPVLEESVDIQRLNACRVIKLFITATRVSDGRPKVFGCGELSVDALLASACIPQLFQAVEIDGVAYWDGGFMGNPVIWPLIYHGASADVLLVQINPIQRGDVPKSSLEINNRINEITFNASLLAEVRAIDFINRLIAAEQLDAKNYQSIRFHLVERPAEMAALNASSKLNASWPFFLHLKALGRQAAQRWLTHHLEAVGVRSSTEVRKLLIGDASATERAPDLPDKISW